MLFSYKMCGIKAIFPNDVTPPYKMSIFLIKSEYR